MVRPGFHEVPSRTRSRARFHEVPSRARSMRLKPGVSFADFRFIWFLMRLGLFGLLGFFALDFLVSLGFLGAFDLDLLGVSRHDLLGPWRFLLESQGCGGA